MKPMVLPDDRLVCKITARRRVIGFTKLRLILEKASSISKVRNLEHLEDPCYASRHAPSIMLD